MTWSSLISSTAMEYQSAGFKRQTNSWVDNMAEAKPNKSIFVQLSLIFNQKWELQILIQPITAILVIEVNIIIIVVFFIRALDWIELNFSTSLCWLF